MRGATIVSACMGCVLAASIACKSVAITSEDASPKADATPIADSAVLVDAAADVDARVLVDADDSDACVPGETWDAKVEITYGPNRWMPSVVTQKSLDVVLLRTKKRRVIYDLCGENGGGCGDCSKSHSDGVACVLTPQNVHVEIGTDDFVTSVNILQRGDTIIADWATEVFAPPPAPPGRTVSHRTEVLIKLPCAVKIRFVR